MVLHELRVRNVINKNQYVVDYKCKEYKDKKTGQLKWKADIFSALLHGKFECNRPPAESLHSGKKGKLYAECYKITEDELVWITDEGIEIRKIKSSDGSMTYQVVDRIDGKSKVVDGFKPFTTTQRSVLIEQFKKAEDISQHNKWTVDKIINLAVVGILGFVIIMGMVFASEILAAYNSVQDKEMGILNEINSMITSVKSDTIPPQTVKKQNSKPTINSDSPPMEIK